MLVCSVACAKYSLSRLDAAVGTATQQEIAQALGPPHAIRERGAQWVYFERGSATSGYSGTARSTMCREYVLTFDQNSVLRGWKRQDCAPS